MAVKKINEQAQAGGAKELTRLMKQGGSQEDVQKKMKELAGTSSKNTAVQKPIDVSGAYSDYRDKILNRENFSYDVNTDALYKQYKDQYVNAGKQAMKDTLGQAAAMTGGYGNSYAQTAGQQAYNQYMTGLTERIPELYQLALDMYDREGDDLKDKYSLLYGEYRDKKGDEQWQQSFDYQKARDAVSDARYDEEWAYKKARDAVSDSRYDEELEYKKAQDAIANALNQASLDEEKRQYDTNLAENKRQFDASLAEDQRQYNTSLAEDQRQYNTSLESISSNSSNVSSTDPLNYKGLGFGSYDDAIIYLEDYAYENGTYEAGLILDEWTANGHITEELGENILKHLTELYGEDIDNKTETSLFSFLDSLLKPFM